MAHIALNITSIAGSSWVGAGPMFCIVVQESSGQMWRLPTSSLQKVGLKRQWQHQQLGDARSQAGSQKGNHLS